MRLRALLHPLQSASAIMNAVIPDWRCKLNHQSHHETVENLVRFRIRQMRCALCGRRWGEVIRDSEMKSPVHSQWRFWEVEQHRKLGGCERCDWGRRIWG